jgi:hypothetical protein
MFKRVFLTAFLGGALLFTMIPNSASADPRRDDSYNRVRHGNMYGADALLHFRGSYNRPDLYFVHPGVGADNSYSAYYGGYYGARPVDFFGDDYFVTFGFRCNGYRDGYYYDRFDRPYVYNGAPRFHRNADCDDFFYRHGYWYGVPVCDRYDFESGYCDNDN